MKLSMIWVCVAVLLGTGAQAMAQGRGQGKKQRQAEPPRTIEAGKPPQVVGGGGAANGKQADKGGKQADKGSKQALENAADKVKEVGKDKKAGQAADAIEKGKAKGKGRQEQLQAFDKQLRHEQGKHMERQARLTRIRELAVQKNDAEMIARVDKLIAKEQQVYGRKQQHLHGQKRAAEPAQAEGQQTPVAPVAPPAQVETPQPVPDANGSTK